MAKLRVGGLSLTVLLVAILAVPWGDAGTSNATSGLSDLFGDGSDGPITFDTSTTFTPPVDAVVDSGTAGGTTLTVSSASGVFQAGQKILIHQTRGTGAGAWELADAQSFALGKITTAGPLANSYSTSGDDRAQVLVIPQYSTLTVDPGVTLTAKSWNGSTGGILAVLASGSAAIDGTISANDAGFRGGQAIASANNPALTGEGTAGPSIQCPCVTPRETAGLGDAAFTAASGAGGGGGGNGGAGGQGWAGGDQPGPLGGGTTGTPDLSIAGFGGGGAGGSAGNTAPSAAGGRGGGFVYLAMRTLNVTGSVAADGQPGGNAIVPSSASAGGGGAGGSILVRAQTADFGSSIISAQGGNGGQGHDGSGGGIAPGGDGSPDGGAGAGGAGRIRAEYCSSISGGTADPPASIAQISCDADTDLDGCTDKQEAGGSATVGGQRDHTNFWDFMDVWTDPFATATYVRDAAITIDDIAEVAKRFLTIGTATTVADALTPPTSPTAYHASYDVGPQIGANMWNVGPASGDISIDDVATVASQYLHSC